MQCEICTVYTACCLKILIPGRFLYEGVLIKEDLSPAEVRLQMAAACLAFTASGLHQIPRVSRCLLLKPLSGKRDHFNLTDPRPFKCLLAAKDGGLRPHVSPDLSS